MTENKLYYGDNLPILKKYIGDDTIDLIYLDPPFNSKATYNILFGGNGKSQAQIHAFGDTWHWGDESERSYTDVMEIGGKPADVLEAFRQFLGKNDMMAYLAMMTPRLIELHRVLKPTGSIYLHCDPTASHYIKIMMDGVFGHENFQNEVVWWYDTGGMSKKRFSRKHDIILFYSNGKKWTFNANAIRTEKNEKQKERFKLAKKYGENSTYRLSSDMKLPHDVFQIHAINPKAKERLGYPTQKPTALLERIIKASSNEGDVVLDPFCGCGTATHVAQRLGRQWIGVDITHLAIGLIEFRLQDAFGIHPKVIGAPEDLAGTQDLFDRNPFQFEAWAVTRLMGIKPNERQTGDGGIDGVGRFYIGVGKSREKQYGKVLVSVKGGKRLDVAMIRDFRGALEREGVELGIFICLHKPTDGMISEAAAAGRYRDLEGYDFPRIQIYTIENFFDGKRPELPPTIGTHRKAEADSGEQHRLI